MRLVVLVGMALVLGGVVIGVTPAASACTSDPDAVCIIINWIGECGAEANVKYPTTTVKNCLP